MHKAGIDFIHQLSYLSEYEGDKLLCLPVAGMDDMREGRERKECAAIKIMRSFKGVVNPVRRPPHREGLDF